MLGSISPMSKSNTVKLTLDPHNLPSLTAEQEARLVPPLQG